MALPHGLDIGNVGEKNHLHTTTSTYLHTYQHMYFLGAF
jgi:hypothetical protein